MHKTIYIHDKNSTIKYENPNTNIKIKNIIPKTRKSNCETPFIMPINAVRKTKNCIDCVPTIRVYKNIDDTNNCKNICNRKIKNSNSIILNNNFFFSNINKLQQQQLSYDSISNRFDKCNIIKNNNPQFLQRGSVSSKSRLNRLKYNTEYKTQKNNCSNMDKFHLYIQPTLTQKIFDKCINDKKTKKLCNNKNYESKLNLVTKKTTTNQQNEISNLLLKNKQFEEKKQKLEKNIELLGKEIQNLFNNNIIKDSNPPSVPEAIATNLVNKKKEFNEIKETNTVEINELNKKIQQTKLIIKEKQRVINTNNIGNDSIQQRIEKKSLYFINFRNVNLDLDEILENIERIEQQRINEKIIINNALNFNYEIKISDLSIKGKEIYKKNIEKNLKILEIDSNTFSYISKETKQIITEKVKNIYEKIDSFDKIYKNVKILFDEIPLSLDKERDNVILTSFIPINKTISFNPFFLKNGFENHKTHTSKLTIIWNKNISDDIFLKNVGLPYGYGVNSTNNKKVFIINNNGNIKDIAIPNILVPYTDENIKNLYRSFSSLYIVWSINERTFFEQYENIKYWNYMNIINIYNIPQIKETWKNHISVKNGIIEESMDNYTFNYNKNDKYTIPIPLKIYEDEIIFKKNLSVVKNIDIVQNINDITLSWDYNKGNDLFGYTLIKKHEKNIQENIIFNTGYIDKNIKIGETYIYGISVFDEYKNISDIFYLEPYTVKNLTIPTPPKLSYIYSDNLIELIWDIQENVNYYKILKYDDDKILLNTFNIKKNNYIDKNVINYINYYYSIIAISSNDIETIETDMIQVTPKPKEVDNPINIKYNINKDSINVTWDNIINNNLAYYMMVVLENDDPFLNVNLNKNNSYIINEIISDYTYTITLWSVNIDGKESVKITKKIKISNDSVMNNVVDDSVVDDSVVDDSVDGSVVDDSVDDSVVDDSVVDDSVVDDSVVDDSVVDDSVVDDSVDDIKTYIFPLPSERFHDKVILKWKRLENNSNKINGDINYKLYNNGEIIKNISRKDVSINTFEINTTSAIKYNYGIEMSNFPEKIFMYYVKHTLFENIEEMKIENNNKINANIIFPKNYRITFEMRLKGKIETKRNIFHIKKDVVYNNFKYESNLLLININKKNNLEIIRGIKQDKQDKQDKYEIDISLYENVIFDLVVFEEKIYIYVKNSKKTYYTIHNISRDRKDISNCDIYSCSPFISQPNIKIFNIRIQELNNIIGISKPNSIQNLKSIGNLDSRIELNWDMSNPLNFIEKYVILSENKEIEKKETTKNKIIYNNLINGKKYKFKIYSISKYGLSSDISFFEDVIPGPFNNTNNNRFIIYKNKNILSWESVYDINDNLFSLLSYKIYRSENDKSKQLLIEIANINLEEYEDFDIKKGIKYDYWISTSYEDNETEHKRFEQLL
jgi:hypothetical protein